MDAQQVVGEDRAQPLLAPARGAERAEADVPGLVIAGVEVGTGEDRRQLGEVALQELVRRGQ